MNSQFEINPFIIQSATAEEYAALNRLNNRMRKEQLPDDPPRSIEETIQNLRTIPPFIELLMWVAWDSAHGELLGNAYVQFFHIEENKHLAFFEINILPEHRQQGLGRQFLSLVTEQSHHKNRRMIMAGTSDRIPAGEAFMLRIGAHKGLEAHTNQLCISDLDTSLVDDWLERSQVNAPDFELGFWDGPYPEEKISEIVQLYELTNQQPTGSLEVDDMHMTPEQLRQVENHLFSRGNQRWTLYLLDRASGKFAGYTETVWNPNSPEILNQDMTGVFPEYRNRGLGRWLKASMLKKVLADRPQVKYIRTGNADSNAAMLKINHELGFKPYFANALWQVEVQKVLAYLHPASVEIDQGV